LSLAMVVGRRVAEFSQSFARGVMQYRRWRPPRHMSLRHGGAVGRILENKQIFAELKAQGGNDRP
jgi:hypothetical protein